MKHKSMISIISIFMVVLTAVLLCAVTFSTSALNFGKPEEYPEFDDNILKLISEKYISEDDPYAPFPWYYKQIYSCYNTNAGSINETEADYVLVEAYTAGDPMEYVKYIGKYVVVNNQYGSPDLLSYYIYVPDTNVVYTLEEAYMMGIDGIDKSFTESGIRSAVVGDSDCDGELNIKDATVIQKKIAGYDVKSCYDSTVESLAEDFNRDGVRNIKDATAIQKYIAKI